MFFVVVVVVVVVVVFFYSLKYRSAELLAKFKRVFSKFGQEFCRAIFPQRCPVTGR